MLMFFFFVSRKSITSTQIPILWCVCVCVFVAGVFRGNQAQVKEYQDLLDPIIFQSYEGKYSRGNY